MEAVPAELLGAIGGDPFPYYEGLRRRCPVSWDAGLGGWLLTDNADCVAASRSDEEFSPRRYSSPAELVLVRSNPRDHHSFSVGPHFCVGAPLVRLEGVEALGALLDRFRGLRLDADAPRPELSGFNLRPVRPLHVCF